MTIQAASPEKRPIAPMDGGMEPGPWLRELVRLKPAPWPWGQAIRSGLGIGLPALLGFMYDATLPALWAALGAMMTTAAEPAGTYRAKIRQMAAASGIGAFGFLAGWLGVLPWPLVVVAMAAVGFAAGIVSSWGSKFSLGAMQFLLLASIALGLPDLSPFVEPALIFAGGAAFQIVTLAIEAAIVRDRPERARITAVIRALADLASTRAVSIQSGSPNGLPVDAARRRAVTDALAALAGDTLATRSRIVGRSTEADAMAAIVAEADIVFARILAESDRDVLARAGTSLAQLAEPVSKGRRPPAPSASPSTPLEAAVAELAATAGATASRNVLDSYVAAVGPPAPGAPAAGRARLISARLLPGPAELRSAIALSLCMALAYATHWLPLGEHWFWVPLTVSLVMKPDLGSIFARAILRSGGTIIGAAIGVALMAVVPKNLEMALVMAVLGLLLPWSMRPSYAVQALVLTPLVLILIGSIAPDTADATLAIHRILDTSLGAAIVLVFGYFIWPRRHGVEFVATLADSKKAVSAYLRVLAVPGDTAAAGAASRSLGRVAYAQLSGFQHRLQLLLVEPPPADREAMAWFPLIATMERICDRITAFAGAPPRQLADTDAALLGRVADRIAMTPRERATQPPPSYDGKDAAVSALIDGVDGELDHLARLQVDGTFPEPPPTGAGARPAVSG